ncbi:hypothetical protein SISNIDRAFT_488478 [Sistotremastrum niveocremeum HHB9708]|uniref:Glycosyltransferase family 25 protein n=1 Tax=Sistotremastrum niveocremeum HHB9708 TaxID=1314777 RepID=A0A164R5E3_9AGAM|nr:hypothetical protein SISNIDRAFT_488478 [Sistotremastrum niveocremeum HHB9708]
MLPTLLLFYLALAFAFSESTEPSIFSIPLPIPIPLKNSFKSLLSFSNSSQSSSPLNETDEENESDTSESSNGKDGRRRKRLPPIYVISLPHRTDRRKNMERLRKALNIPLSSSSLSFVSESDPSSLHAPLPSPSPSPSPSMPSEILESSPAGLANRDNRIFSPSSHSRKTKDSKEAQSTVLESKSNSGDSVMRRTPKANLKHSILRRHKRLRRVRRPSVERPEGLSHLEQLEQIEPEELLPRNTLSEPDLTSLDDLEIPDSSTHPIGESHPAKNELEPGDGDSDDDDDADEEWTYIPAIPSTSPQISAIISHVRAYRLWLSSHNSSASSSTPSPSSASSTSFTSASSTSRTDENGPVELPNYKYADTSLWPYTSLPQLSNSNSNSNSKEQDEPLTCAVNDTIPIYKPTMKHYRILSRGMIACWLSHLNTLNFIARHFHSLNQTHNQTRVSRRTRTNAAIILEDDVDMESDIIEIVEEVLNNVPPEWDIIFLGTPSLPKSTSSNCR